MFYLVQRGSRSPWGKKRAKANSNSYTSVRFDVILEIEGL